MKPVETIENIGSCDIGESPANFRRYVAGLLSASAIWLLALLGINIGVDPFADFYFLTGRRQPSVYTLDSYADMKFKVGRVREAGLNGVRVAVFGSSRVMRIDPADAAFASGPGCALNLGVQGGNLPQAIQFVDFVLSRNPECTPIVGLDLFAFDTRRNAKSIYLDEAAPSAARIDTLSRLASNETFTTSLAMLRGRKATNSLLPSGLAVKPPPNPVARQAILEGFADHAWRKFAPLQNFVYQPTRIEDLRALRARYPRTVFFINPVSRWYRTGQQKAGVEPAHLLWVAELTALGGVIDFSEASVITCTAEYYLDFHHYNSEAGALMMRDIANYLSNRPLLHGRVLGGMPQP